MRAFGVALLCGPLAGCSALFPFTSAEEDAGGGADGDADTDADADGDGDADGDADGDGDADQTCAIRMELEETVGTEDAAVSLVVNGDFLWVVEYEVDGVLLEQLDRQDFGNRERLWAQDALEATALSGFIGVDGAKGEPGELVLEAGGYVLTVAVGGDLTDASIRSWRPAAVGGPSAVAFDGGTILVAGAGLATFGEGGQQHTAPLDCAARDVAAADGDVWIACSDGGVVPGTFEPASSALTLEEPLFPGDARAVALDSGLAFVATPNGALSIYRQEGRVALATEVGPSEGGGQRVAVAVWGPYALVAAQERMARANALRAFDVRDPSAPEPCTADGSFLPLDTAPIALAIQADTAYVALGADGVAVVNLSR